VWGAAEVVGAARGAAKVGEISDEGAAQVLAVGPPEVAVGPLASVRRGGGGWSDLLGSRSDRLLRPAVESPVEHGAPTVVQARELHRQCHPA
jgi:hypothetical protein